jgi:heme/copper-type cytochrome/quinol oxidase subunit 2
MRIRRRTVGLLLIGAGTCVLAGPAVARLFAAPAAGTTVEGQEMPNRRGFTIEARSYRFVPDRIEVTQDDLVKITLRGDDQVHSFAIDEYRIVKRVPAGGSTTFEFRADRPGTFPFYCGMTGSEGHDRMRGQLVVRAR